MLVFIFIEFGKQTPVECFFVQSGLFIDNYFVFSACHGAHVRRRRQNYRSAYAEVRKEQLAEVLINNGILFLVNDFYRNIFQRQPLHAGAEVAGARQSDERRDELRYRMTEGFCNYKAVARRACHGVRNAARA